MIRAIATASITLAALVGSSNVAVAQTYGQAPGTSSGIAEDDPRWDCRTMGNEICGPGQGVQAGQYVDGNLVPWGTLAGA